MSFITKNVNISELKENYIGALIGGIVGGWILMSIIGQFMMNPTIFAMLAGIMFNNPNDTSLAIMFHVMMSIIYALLFVVIFGKKFNGDIKVILFGVIYGLVLMVILLMAIVAMTSLNN